MLRLHATARARLAAGVCLGVLGLGGCGANPNVFIVTSPSPARSSLPKPKLPLDRLTALRAKLWAGLVPHLAGGHLEAGWGPGGAVAPAGPWPDAQPARDALGLLALRAAASAPASPAPPAGADQALAASVAGGFDHLDGPEGGAYMLLSRLASYSSLPDAPCAGGAAAFDCARQREGERLAAGWYAGDTRTFFHVGDSTTDYRPVDAFAVGAALAAYGYAQHDFSHIDAALAIAQSESNADFDPLTGLVYARMSAAATGSRQATDSHSHVADQAGIAELLLEAFDLSREGAFKLQAATVLQALADERISLRSSGYAQTVDLHGDASQPLAGDLLATLLVLEAAHHYDVDDGGRFGALELTAADELLGAACAPPVSVCDAGPGGVDPGGLPVIAGAARSGLVTALAVTTLTEVLSDRYAGAG